jgi:hypothetical protein
VSPSLLPLLTTRAECLKHFSRTDYLLYPDGAFVKSLGEWMTDKSGILGRFPFGAFVFKRFDEELKDNAEWQEALKKSKGQDPMDASNGMPHIEYVLSAVG